MGTSSPPRPSRLSTRSRPPKRPQVRVIVVDDHPAIQVALSDTFEAEMDLQLCGCASNATDAFALVERETPDVAVIDVALQDA
ncbi:MAG: response regulator, partial [Bacteroidetes bacterium]|nr:response regulator [Bacteroidota bacterium]